jgi:predicted dinucleotide-binding enzyme
MRVAVLGTGSVARALAGRLDGLGHPVTVGTRVPDETLARTEPGSAGPPFRTWYDDHAGVAVATFADAARDAELVVLATSGEVALTVLAGVGAEHLAGKVLLDISNPLDFSAGFPPTLFVEDTDSLGETIQRTYPDARVVKSLNTLTAALMVDPQQLGRSSTVFVSGDDDEAKATVTALLESFGHDDVVDLGDLSTARGAEMYLPLWLRLMGALGTATFNIQVVRGGDAAG